MDRNDFEAVWVTLDGIEARAHEMRRRWPGCPVDSLVVAVLQLRHWLTTTWAAEHSAAEDEGD